MPALNVHRTSLNELPLDVLRLAFYGMRNIGISSQMAEWMNPDEIFAKFVGAQRVKSWNAHLPKDGRGIAVRPEVPPEFRHIIRTLDDSGYGYLRGRIQHWEGPFRRMPGDQLDRLSNLDTVLQSDFVESFLRPYTEITNDPNRDGTDKNLYAREIYRYLQRLEAQLGPIHV